MVVEPEMELIERVEARWVGEVVSIRLIVCTEEDSGREDSLECLRDSAIVAPVLRQVKEVEHLSGTFKANCTALLLYGERGYPDGNESVLTEGDGRFIMHPPQ